MGTARIASSTYETCRHTLRSATSIAASSSTTCSIRCAKLGYTSNPMSAVPRVVLDACVLVPQSLCELLLRLGEAPGLYSPVWSTQILHEAYRAFTVKLPRRWTQGRADRWIDALVRAFPEALENPDPGLLANLTNDPEDRHVLATAIGAEASIIVTFNLKDFREESLIPWNVQALSPDEFLLLLFYLSPSSVAQRVKEVARRNGTSSGYLKVLGRLTPRFVAALRDEFHVEEGVEGYKLEC